MKRAEGGEGLQDHKVKRALEKIEFGISHGSLLCACHRRIALAVWECHRNASIGIYEGRVEKV